MVTIVVVIVDVISRITLVLNISNIKILNIENVMIIRFPFKFEIGFLPIQIRLIIISKKRFTWFCTHTELHLLS